ncbi:MAG TPA: PrgI family protein [Candidatus Woesebacteria bacterium]|nr:PrgI family protein [Candidatus Woesebacteria bacterium]
MEQHPIPRQITTFEFKLIGFMTLKQFLYLVIFCPIGYIVATLLPIPIVNILMGILIGGIGAAFAFLPIMDRPLDVWLKNMYKRLNAPSQYFYLKKNDPVYFLKDLFFLHDPHITMTHVESKEKLHEYLSKQQKPATGQDSKMRDKQKIHIDDLLQQNLQLPQTVAQGQSSQTTTLSHDVVKQPFVSGVVKNRKQIPIPGILVTIKDAQGQQLRILKTNPYGIFATYSPLPEGDYLFEVGDPNGNYFFDTMNVRINPKDQKPIVFYSKEIL